MMLEVVPEHIVMIECLRWLGLGELGEEGGKISAPESLAVCPCLHRAIALDSGGTDMIEKGVLAVTSAGWSLENKLGRTSLK
jgi:hypothetical protein